MHDASTAGPHFHASHEAARGEWNRHDEIPEYVGAAGSQRVRLRQLDHEIGLPELPAVDPCRRRVAIGRIAFGRSVLHPLRDTVDVLGS